MLVALLGAACAKSKPLVCDGPTAVPGESEPCPPGTSIRPGMCPEDTCHYCERPDRTHHGPYLTWYSTEVREEIIPDKHGRWGSQSYWTRGRIREAGWLKNGVRNGLFVRWYESGKKAVEATYCNGVLREPVRRWSEQGAPLDGGAGWLAPPDGGA